MNGEGATRHAAQPEAAAGSALQALIEALASDEKPKAAAQRAEAAIDAWRRELDARREARAAEAEAEAEAEAARADNAERRAAEGKPLAAPTVAPIAFDPENGFDVNAFLDDVCLEFEAAAGPSTTLQGGFLGAAGEGPSVGLDAARAARIAAEAREIGCPPEAILATALDFYFTVVDRADARAEDAPLEA